MMRRRIGFLFLILALPAALFATGQQGSDTGGAEGPKQITIFNTRPARETLPEGVDFYDNPYINYIRETSGIDPIYLRPERSTYYDKLTLIMSSGDLPDLVQGRFSDMYKFVDDGLILPLDDLLQEYGQDILAHMPENLWDHVTVDGKIYALPAVYFYPIPGKDTIPNRVLWVRRDWMNTLGLSDPVTLDDFTELLRQFKNGDPDGNGADDTMGISAFIRDGDLRGLDPIFGAFGVVQTHGLWSEDGNGGVIHNTVKPQMKEALAYLNSIYEEGLLDPEFFLNDQNAWMERVYQGKVGLWLGSWWEPTNRTEKIVANTGVESMPGGLVKPIHCPTGPYGDRGNGASLSLSEGLYFITVDSEHPEWAMQFYNWRFSPAGINFDFGFEGENFNFVDGVRVKSADNPKPNWVRAYHTSYVPWNEADFRQYVLDSVNKDPDTFEIAWNALDISAQDGVASVIPYYQSPAVVEYGAELQKLWIEYAVKIITGEYSIDKWDEYVDLWMNNGGREMTEEMSDYYRSK